MTYDDWVRLVLIAAVVPCGLLTGALSHQRAHSQSKAQALVRAGITLFFLSTAFGAVVALNDWPVSLRVTPPTIIALFTLAGLVEDTRDELRKHPESGPFRLAAKYLPRWRRGGGSHRSSR